MFGIKDMKKQRKLVLKNMESKIQVKQNIFKIKRILKNLSKKLEKQKLKIKLLTNQILKRKLKNYYYKNFQI